MGVCLRRRVQAGPQGSWDSSSGDSVRKLNYPWSESIYKKTPGTQPCEGGALPLQQLGHFGLLHHPAGENWQDGTQVGLPQGWGEPWTGSG